MKVLVCGGVKAPNVVKVLESNLKSSGIDFITEQSIGCIADLFTRGDYFDRAILTEQCWTDDGNDKNEQSIRWKINRFITEITQKNLSNDTTFVFLCQTKEMATVVSEEILPIIANSAIVVKKPKYYANFFVSLVTSELNNLPEEYVFKGEEESDTQETKLEDFKEVDNSTGEFDPNYVGEFDGSVNANNLPINEGVDADRLSDPQAFVPDATGEQPDMVFDDSLDQGFIMPKFDGPMQGGPENYQSNLNQGNNGEQSTNPGINLNKDSTQQNQPTDFNFDLDPDNFDQLQPSNGTDAEGMDSTDWGFDNDQDFQIGDSDITGDMPDPFSDNQGDTQGFQDGFSQDDFQQDDFQGDTQQGGFQQDDFQSGDQDFSQNSQGDTQENIDEPIQIPFDLNKGSNEQPQMNQSGEIPDWSGPDYTNPGFGDIPGQELYQPNDQMQPQFDDSDYSNQAGDDGISDSDYSQPNNNMSYDETEEPPEQPQPVQRSTMNSQQVRDSFSAFASRGNSIVVTGCGGCGTSTIAMNLANTICNLGYNVLLVDMDTKNKTQSYISKEQYDSLDAESAGVMQAVNSSSGINAHIAIARQGFHLLTMGMASDSREINDAFKKDKLTRFVNMARSSHNFVIYDIPFEAATTHLESVTYAADNIVLVVDASNWGVAKTLINVCNIASDDMTETLFNRAQILFNKFRGMNKVLGKKVRRPSDITKAMDIKMTELIGESTGYSFNEMSICGTINDDPAFEQGWFNNVQYSDTRKGNELFVGLLRNIVLNVK